MTTTHTRAYDRYVPVLAEYAALDADDPRVPALRDHLVRGYRPLVRNIAVRFARRGEPTDDLEQVAAIGLINALDRFDPARQADFLAYAIPTMMGEVRRHFRDASWSVRTPRGVKERYLRVGAATATWSQQWGRSPTVTELAAFLELSVAEVQEAYVAGSSYQPASLDRALVEADEPALIDMIGTLDSGLDQVEARSMVGGLLAQLPERERRMLVMRFVHEYTQREIAEVLCISQMHVSRLLTQTLALLRERVEQQPGTECESRLAAG